MVKQEKLTGMVSKNQFGQRLDQVLVKMFPNYSRSCIKRWIIGNHVLINDKTCYQPSKKVFGGEVVSVSVHIEKVNFQPKNIPLNIVYEDNYIIIIDKPPNLVVHPTTNNCDYTVLNGLLYYYPPIIHVPRAGIVHRLDKDTTGLMIIAKTVLTYNRLVKSLQRREITREYEAVVVGYVMVDGTIEQSIKRHPIKRTHMFVHPTGKPAVTHYRIIEHFRTHTYLRLRLETGRTHQIRVHMSHIMHPLVGDRVYGSNSFTAKNASEWFITILRKFSRQALHATMLRFHHPISGAEMEWHAPIPDDMLELIKVMRFDANKNIQSKL